MPPLMKLWLDDVLRYGWAYGPAAPRCKARTCGWWPAPAAPRSPTTRRATTAISSTPSCRPTSRPRPVRHALPAAAGAARRAPRRAPPRSATRTPTPSPSGLASYPDWPEIDDLPPAGLRRARRRTGPPPEGSQPDGTRTRLADQQPDLPGRGGARGAAVRHSAWAPSSATWPPASPSALGLGLVTNVEDILHFAEFGVVLMLFLVGLELEPRRLWSLRRPIFGWGSVQVLGCAALLFAVGVAGRRALARGAGGGAGPGAVVHRHRAAGDGRAQPAAHQQRPGRLLDPAVPGRGRDPDPGLAAAAGRGSTHDASAAASAGCRPPRSSA
jgi:hypothetical protein